jgi:hypothetical protein
MKRKAVFVLIVFGLVSIMLAGQEVRQFIELKKIASLPTPEDSTGLHAAVVDSRGNLFAVDYLRYCIYKYDPSLKLLKIFGRKGQGPGEISQSFSISIDDKDNVYIFEFPARLLRFDNGGNYLDEINLNKKNFGDIGSVKILKENKAIARCTVRQGSKMRNEVIVFQINPARILSRFPLEDEYIENSGRFLCKINSKVITAGGMCLIASRLIYHFYIIDATGEKILDKINPGIKRIRYSALEKAQLKNKYKDSFVKDQEFEKIIDGEEYHDIFNKILFSGDTVYIFAEPMKTKDEEGIPVDVYDLKGELVKKAKFKKIPVLIHKKYAYFVSYDADEFPIISKYEMK